VTSSGDSITVRVSDQGRGFDPEILQKRTDKIGFGLLTIKERANYIGGAFTIESAPGQGCCFILTVPYAPENIDEEVALPASGIEESKPLRSKAAKSAANRTGVLFVDDHLVMRQGLIKLIKGQPSIYIAGEASNGRQAIEQARKLRPGVIVMDISMPQMDGIEATRHIKAEMPEVRIIGLTMHDDEQLANAMQQAGADVVLSKATSSSELLKAIYRQPN
jgi:CheY-like chemotaxis protein